MIAGHYFIPEVSKTRFLCDLNVEKAKICNQAQGFNFAKTRYLQFVKKEKSSTAHASSCHPIDY